MAAPFPGSRTPTPSRGRISVVLGAQLGDEAKARFVDNQAEDAEAVVRFQGADNCGHTIVFKIGGRTIKVALHLVPSGVARPGVHNLIARGVLVNPHVLKKEVGELTDEGLDTAGRLWLDAQATVITDFHVALDHARELARGKKKIGTTKRGVGPTAATKTRRRPSIRVHHIFDDEVLRSKVEQIWASMRHELTEFDGGKWAQVSKVDEVVAGLRGLRSFLRPLLVNGTDWLREKLAAGWNIIAEGGQGAGLCFEQGDGEHCTTTITTIGAVFSGTGISPQDLGDVWSIFKPYLTGVGNHIMPTRLTPQGEKAVKPKDIEAEYDLYAGWHMQTTGHEFGATTGRPRDCAWLDLVRLRHYVELNGTTHLAMAKLDVMTGLRTIKVCVGYRPRSELEELAAPMAGTPIYMEFDGWDEDITGCRTYEELPGAAQRLIEFIERRLNLPISMIGVGPEREELIDRREELLAAA